MKSRAFFFAGASIAVILSAGCATSAPQSLAGADPYGATLYTGAPQPDAADLYSQLYAPDQTSANGAPFELVSFAGLEGARRAHALYTDAEAEALDGRCEEKVSPLKTESLIDIAELCDVPLDMLVEYNPGVADISYSTSGATVQIPGGLKAPQGVSAMSGQLLALDAVQPGDTLEKIAWRLDVSEAAIANLNPGIDWKNPVAGQTFVKPAAAAAAPAASSSFAPPAPQWEGWGGASGIAASDAGSVAVIDAHAPYALSPVKSYGRATGSYPQASLSVDREFVKAGGSVNVTAKATPGADVTFYSGVAPGALTKSTTVRADEAGKATASIKVGKKSNMGGVVFGARAAGSDETQFSRRVGVVNLEEGAPAEDAGN